MDFSIPTWGLFAIAIILISIVASVISTISGLKKTNEYYNLKMAERETNYTIQLSERELAFKNIEMGLRNNINTLALEQFEKYKVNELEGDKKIIREAAIKEAEALLRGWVIDSGDKLRKDAIVRSMGVNFGKITEHLVPFSDHLKNFDPRDVRFIGSPVDLMIFDGATAKKDTINIHFVEIKTGGSQLSKKQKTIREAILFHRVHWLPIVVPEFKWDVPDEEA